MRVKLSSVLILVVCCAVTSAQPPANVGFRSVVEKHLKSRKLDINKICPATDVVADRVLRDYGAIFVSKGTSLPTKCVFDSAEAEDFQAQAEPYEMTVGGVNITLQRAAMDAFEDAINEAKKSRIAITPRGGTTASTRSYAKTVDCGIRVFSRACVTGWPKKELHATKLSLP